MSNYLIAGADISKCGRFRYSLTRTWAIGGEHVVFCGLNPSKADGTIDDNTIRKEVVLAKSKGYGGLIMLNLYPFRATYPKDLEAFMTRITTAEYRDMFDLNDAAIAGAIHGRDLVEAWGAHPLVTEYRVKEFRRLWMAAESKVGAVYRLGERTKAGHPRHPLYVKNDVPWEVFLPKAKAAV